VWLERMVQALVSCVTSGNVKVLQEIVLLNSLSTSLISESFSCVLSLEKRICNFASLLSSLGGNTSINRKCMISPLYHMYYFAIKK